MSYLIQTQWCIYMCVCQWTRSSLFQVMACCRYGSKPIPHVLWINADLLSIYLYEIWTRNIFSQENALSAEWLAFCFDLSELMPDLRMYEISRNWPGSLGVLAQHVYLVTHYTPPIQWSWKGGILVSRRPSACPSVRQYICPPVCQCGQNHICSASSTILAGSISYLHIVSTGCPAVREKSGKFQTWQKSGKSQGILLKVREKMNMGKGQGICI